MTAPRYEPLRIDFFLSSPLCLGGYEYVRLDGVVARLRARRVGAAHGRMSGGKVELASAGGMRAIYYRGVYHASVGLLDADAPPDPEMPLRDTPDTDGTIYKQLETGMLCDSRLARLGSWTHTPGTGPYKHAAVRLVTHPVRRVRFYALADRRVLEELLDGLPAIGKKTSIGYGQVESYEIVSVHEDRSVVWGGKAMRSIPRWMLDECEFVEMSGWRPPYWHRRDAAQCAPPGVRVKLVSGERLRKTRMRELAAR